MSQQVPPVTRHLATSVRLVRKGAYPLDPARVQKARAEKGWSQEQLATRARCSKKTIERAEQGKPLYNRNAVAIAAALGVEVGILMPPDCSSVEPVDTSSRQGAGDTNEAQTPGSVRVEIVIDQDFNTYPESEQERLLRKVKLALLMGAEEIRVVGKRPGSVRLSIELTPEQAERLLEAIGDGALDDCSVTAANVFQDDLLDVDARESLRRLQRLEECRLEGAAEGMKHGTAGATAGQDPQACPPSSGPITRTTADDRPRGYGMVHTTCDLCGMDLDREGATQFVVKVEQFADPAELTDDDLDTAHIEGIAQVLSEIEDEEDDPVELPTCSKMRFDLCTSCYRKFVKDPLSREHDAKPDFSEN
jgi:transcriptional regulator with XRE-family HTH domain